ncbi:cupin-like domain-containing protein [Lysinibacillus xylanilyticus]|uniref:cupin-like domain-containing protein n=1 Tax=Lysinibacillus xylanilyticus TaxID=582475 RepID=UPI003D07262F
MIERIDINDLTYEKFMAEYADKKPVIITGAMNDWNSFNWTLEKFGQLYGERSVPIRESTIDGVRNFKKVNLAEYINYLEHNENNWYCDWNFHTFGDQDLVQTYKPLDIFTRETVRINTKKQIFKWFFLGSANTQTPLHQDFDNTHAWNAVIFGQKEWIFFEKSDSPYLYEGKVDLFSDYDLEDYPLLEQANPMKIVQNAGEIIYAPRFWWHQVRNTESTLAISENFWFETELLNGDSKF